ncbi:cytochrome P450 [Gandjariella thermophila]|uniref:Cytochrome P450 n=1 Tax=Gandjariella thermophila TaxID=1931992 RepID=A0A4D4J3C8_9PSEU|nr:cytochrome P450 [Gandjariella thermophila]GDY29582.1 cytochrome P450 [Gandjariella thermophila]
MTDSALTSDVAADFVFDPFADGFTDDPYPHYEHLRAADPVHESPLGFWILADYEDVSALLRSGHSVEERHIAPGSPLRAINQEAYGDRPRRMDGLSMLDKDPPDHTRLRRLVSKAFTPRAVNRLEPRVTALVDEVLDRIAEAGQVDLVAELAFPLPFAVISEMLGTPEVDHLRLRELSGTLVRSLEPVVDPETLNRIVDADNELGAIAQDMITWKRGHPADDLLSALIAAEEGGDVLSDDELVAQVLLLYIAGHETTVNLIGGGVLALLRNPDALALLRERPDLAGNAVEELLRYDSPVQMSRRITLEPYRVRDREIPAGSFVIACLASANRDPKFWGADAAELRLDRDNARQHVSFGAGVHHCLGAALARMEARIAISRLVRRFPDLGLHGVRWNGRINLRGPETLTVSV